MPKVQRAIVTIKAYCEGEEEPKEHTFESEDCEVLQEFGHEREQPLDPWGPLKRKPNGQQRTSIKLWSGMRKFEDLIQE
jgi:hypothetical protein